MATNGPQSSQASKTAKPSGKKKFQYSDLILQAVCDLAEGCTPDNYPIQARIVEKVAARAKEITGDIFERKQIQSTVSRILRVLIAEGELLSVDEKRFAPNTPEHIRNLTELEIPSKVKFGRPDAFVSARVISECEDEPSTVTLIIDIGDTAEEKAESIFRKYLGLNGFWVVATDHFLQLMIIGSEEDVTSICTSIKQLVRHGYEEQNKPPVEKPPRFKKPKAIKSFESD